MKIQRKDAKMQSNGRSADFQVCWLVGFQTRYAFARLADLEIGDTAGLETCATDLRLCAFAPLRWNLR
jgi:hypothetical protein